ncbi:MAG: SDR family oxidoreductase [Saprospiraceae bacterium]
MKQFNNKVIAITGAGSGIGRALAVQLAKHGTLLALNDWDETALLETLALIGQTPDKILFKVFDVRERDSWDAFLAAILHHFGRVDGLINNAGATVFSGAAVSISSESYERILDINLWSVIHGSQAFVPKLLESPDALLVNMSSLLGLIGYAGQAPYVVSKFAIRGFTETLRQELMGTSVKVVQVHPGPIRTNLLRNAPHENQDLIDYWANAYDKASPTSAEEAAARILKDIQKGKLRIVFGHNTPLLDIISRLLPQRYHRFIPHQFRNGQMRQLAEEQAGKTKQGQSV